jgi:thiol-disulfide isomerase/thioredoxin
MNKIICLLLFVYCSSVYGQTTSEKPKIIYGICTKDSLVAEPFGTWYSTGYDGYAPQTATIAAIKKTDFSGIEIKAFFGTWCGDSKREVPRFLKLLSAISFPDKKLQLIGLGGSDSLVKQSPQHEEAGLGIFRVPTFIIYKNGVEINRINEYPVNSLEKDLLAILANQPYDPNYRSFKTVLTWLKDGSLLDENNSVRGLAEQLRNKVSTENELNSLGYLLLKQGKKKEALRIFQVNYNLYPTSSNIASSLGEGYLENAEYQKAVAALERSLELNKEPAAFREILALLYKAKEKESK